MTPTLRPAEPADLKAAADLIRDQQFFEPYGMTTDGLEKSLSAALNRDEQVHVAEHDGRTLGLIWFQLRGTFGRSGYLRLLVTDPMAQGQGIGGSLLAMAEELVFAQADDFFLLVNTDNEAARRFYARHGYDSVGTLTDYVAPGLDELIMRKTRPV